MTGESVDLHDGGYDYDGNLAAWSWEFGDGGVSNARNTSHSYAKSGTYTVKLTEWDDQGAGAIATQQVVVHNRAPEGAITAAPQEPVAGPDGHVRRGRERPDRSIAAYAWDFGAVRLEHRRRAAGDVRGRRQVRRQGHDHRRRGSADDALHHGDGQRPRLGCTPTTGRLFYQPPVNTPVDDARHDAGRQQARHQARLREEEDALRRQEGPRQAQGCKKTVCVKRVRR